METMNTRLWTVVLGVLAIVTILGSCGNLDGLETPSPRPTREDMDAQVDRCMDAYLKNGASQETIDAGIERQVIEYDPTTNQYIIGQGDAFFKWVFDYNVPVSDMYDSVLKFDECAYITLDPVAEAEHQAQEKAANDCLDTWVNEHGSEKVIQRGVELGVITTDPSTNLLHADPRNKRFITWIWDDAPFTWNELRVEVIYGSGCPYS